MTIRRLCVFCGSSRGRNPAYSDAASGLGELLAEQEIGLVYGGTSIGLMSVVADAALRSGGEVIGVIPQSLIDREIAHTGLSDLQIVSSMHERKKRMGELSDGFVALPGGLGTLEEAAEVLTWAQLRIHTKPCGFLNVAGFFDPLLRMFDHAVEQGFLSAQHREMVLVEDQAQVLLERFHSYVAPADKWGRTDVTAREIPT
ncbi:MAG TPA: TIGR00730 family Rossman fold protein [Actinomycetota bacterium]|nr:TIGR00730 family Rossman fold protein [Actinomycetota bacterium]